MRNLIFLAFASITITSCLPSATTGKQQPPPSTTPSPATDTPAFEVFDCPGEDGVSAFVAGETIEIQAQQFDVFGEDAEDARFLWTLSKAPPGVDASALSSGTTRRALLNASVAGSYQACFTTDQGTRDCCTLSAVDGFRAQSVDSAALAGIGFIAMGTTTSAADAEVEDGLHLWLAANQDYDDTALTISEPSGVGRFADAQRVNFGGGLGLVEFWLPFDATSAGRALADGDAFTWHLVAEPEISGGEARLDVPVALAPRASSAARIVAAHIERDGGAAVVVIDLAEPHDSLVLVDVGGWGLPMETDPVDGAVAYVDEEVASGQRVGLRPWSQNSDTLAFEPGPVFFVTAP